MSKNRTIQVIGDIDDAAYKEFSSNLAVLEYESVGKPVLVELCSPGGSSYAALAFASRVRLSKCLITVRAIGFVASAAVLILAAGDTRQMTSEAWVMVHEDSDKLNGNVVELERESAHLRRMEDQWAALLELYTKLHAVKWSALHKKTTYLSATECLNLNLVDKII